MNITKNKQKKIKIEIEKIGGVLKTDKNNYLIKKASLKLIGPFWLKIVETAVKKYKKEFGEKISSMYLRGSIAQGTAIKGISDLDIIIILNNQVSEADKKVSLKIEKALTKQFPFIKRYDINLATLEEAKNSRKISFFIKIQSTCIYGKNIDVEFSKIKPGEDTAIHSKYLNRILENRRVEITKSRNKKQIKGACSGLMKAILRVGYELVAGREKAFTRDLYFCYEGFIKYYPEKEREMYQALDLAINPISDKKEILNIIDVFGGWLNNEVKKSVKHSLLFMK